MRGRESAPEHGVDSLGWDSDRYDLANYLQNRPACLRFLGARHGKAILVTVLRT